MVFFLMDFQAEDRPPSAGGESLSARLERQGRISDGDGAGESPNLVGDDAMDVGGPREKHDGGGGGEHVPRQEILVGGHEGEPEFANAQQVPASINNEVAMEVDEDAGEYAGLDAFFFFLSFVFFFSS